MDDVTCGMQMIKVTTFLMMTRIPPTVVWEWTHTDAKSRAFISPLMLISVNDSYDGVNNTGDDDDA